MVNAVLEIYTHRSTCNALLYNLINGSIRDGRGCTTSVQQEVLCCRTYDSGLKPPKKKPGNALCYESDIHGSENQSRFSPGSIITPNDPLSPLKAALPCRPRGLNRRSTVAYGSLVCQFHPDLHSHLLAGRGAGLDLLGGRGPGLDRPAPLLGGRGLDLPAPMLGGRGSDPWGLTPG